MLQAACLVPIMPAFQIRREDEEENQSSQRDVRRWHLCVKSHYPEGRNNTHQFDGLIPFGYLLSHVETFTIEVSQADQVGRDFYSPERFGCLGSGPEAQSLS